jgi:hypothetical protein
MAVITPNPSRNAERSLVALYRPALSDKHLPTFETRIIRLENIPLTRWSTQRFSLTSLDANKTTHISLAWLTQDWFYADVFAGLREGISTPD